MSPSRVDSRLGTSVLEKIMSTHNFIKRELLGLTGFVCVSELVTLQLIFDIGGMKALEFF